LCGTAGVFFLLGADFVGATQLLVYVGGTLVLVVFGVMLTAQGPFINMKIGAAEWVIGLGAGMLLFSVLAISLLTVKADGGQGGVEPAASADKLDPQDDLKAARRLPSSVAVGESFLGFEEATRVANVTGMASWRPRQRMAYLLVFEIVSVHLLVVLIGAAYLARAKRRRGEVS
jgi:NADH-quinone oxidoreductase subunit J